MSRIAVITVGLVVLGGCARPPLHLQHVAPAEIEHKLAAATATAPGIVYGVVGKDGQTILRSAGMADLRTGRKMRPDTVFAWFSVTKLFTATAILQLAEQGKVALDAPAADYLPGIHLRRDGREATVRELLSHTAGIPNPALQVVTWIHPAGEAGPTLDAVIAARLGNDPELDFVPGTKAAYSNLGFVLLGKIVENVAKTRYEAYVADNVLTPLGCQDSGFAVPPDRATAYMKKWTIGGMAIRWLVGERYFAGTIAGYSELTPFTVDGASFGGLNGPADCLLRFGAMMLQDGRGAAGQVLSPASVAAMLKPTLLRDGTPSPFGLAWNLGQVDGEMFATHDGGGGGYRAELKLYPHLGYAVVALANESRFPIDEWTYLIAREPPRQAGR